MEASKQPSFTISNTIASPPSASVVTASKLLSTAAMSAVTECKRYFGSSGRPRIKGLAHVKGRPFVAASLAMDGFVPETGARRGQYARTAEPGADDHSFVHTDLSTNMANVSNAYRPSGLVGCQPNCLLQHNDINICNVPESLLEPVETHSDPLLVPAMTNAAGIRGTGLRRALVPMHMSLGSQGM
ncbi:unnamed protein product [Protopolystoma xenopodis]|uniref:Uncharacterized protein n=1 Tax=Protopolystoma xenopodis TaxID=117903 RepID=A0A3S5AY69_9PLAT|nr:unnamed protein product [Protopolystoma xenopodis]